MAVYTLLTGEYQIGPYSVTWNARGHPSGAYFFQLKAGGEATSRKVFVVR